MCRAAKSLKCHASLTVRLKYPAEPSPSVDWTWERPPRRIKLIANGLQFAQGMGDVISTLGGKQQFCPPPPGFHIRTAAGGDRIDDHQNRTVYKFSLTSMPNPGHTIVRIL